MPAGMSKFIESHYNGHKRPGSIDSDPSQIDLPRFLSSCTTWRTFLSLSCTPSLIVNNGTRNVLVEESLTDNCGSSIVFVQVDFPLETCGASMGPRKN